MNDKLEDYKISNMKTFHMESKKKPSSYIFQSHKPNAKILVTEIYAINLVSKNLFALAISSCDS